MYSEFNLLQIIFCFEFLSDIDNNIRLRILTIIFVSAWALYNIFKINILIIFNYSFLDNCTVPFLKINSMIIFWILPNIWGQFNFTVLLQTISPLFCNLL